MGSLVDAAQQLAQQLAGAGIKATHDPAKAATQRPCVLVPPPAVDYVRRTNTWRLALLAGQPAGTLAALRQLDELLTAVVDQLPVEAADPGSYVLSADLPAVPAYIVRMTT